MIMGASFASSLSPDVFAQPVDGGADDVEGFFEISELGATHGLPLFQLTDITLQLFDLVVAGQPLDDLVLQVNPMVGVLKLAFDFIAVVHHHLTERA
jgi:hypothetical protein